MRMREWPPMRRAGRIGLALALLAAPAAAETLTMAPGDTVAVSVLGRADLSGNFTLRSDGTISMHVIGATEAAGLTEAELEDRLEARLAGEMQLPASVTVWVDSWRPVYVLGGVVAPGAFDYRLGMTVEQAVALAGGYDMGTVTGSSSLSMRVVDQAATLDEIGLRLTELSVRRARLEAEAAQLDSFAGQEGGKDEGGDEDGARAAMTAEQQRLFESRGQVVHDRQQAAGEVKVLAGNEADSLAAQRQLLSQQIAEQEASVADLQALFDKGLASSERLREARRGLTADRIELMTAASFEARARQEVAATDASVSDFMTGRQRDIAEELADIGSQQRSAEHEMAAARQFLAEFGPRVGYLDGEPGPPVFLVTRHDSAAAAAEELLELAATDPLRPGDLVEVVRQPAQPAE